MPNATMKGVTNSLSHYDLTANADYPTELHALVVPRSPRVKQKRACVRPTLHRVRWQRTQTVWPDYDKVRNLQDIPFDRPYIQAIADSQVLDFVDGGKKHIEIWLHSWMELMQQYAEDNEYPAEDDEEQLVQLSMEQAIAYEGYDFYIPAVDEP